MRSKPANQKSRIRLLQSGGLLILLAFMMVQPVFSHDGSDTIECFGVALVLLDARLGAAGGGGAVCWEG